MKQSNLQRSILMRYNSVLLAFILTVVACFYAKNLLMLLIFAMFLAMLLNPLAVKLEKKGISRVWSTILCLLVVLLTFAVFISMITLEVNSLSKQWPMMQKKGFELFHNIQETVESQFGLAVEEQDRMLREQTGNLQETAKKYGKSLLRGTAGFITSFVMVLIFMFLFLLQKEKYREFLLWIFDGNDKQELKNVIGKISGVAQKYLLGMLYSIGIVTVLYSIGFLIVGLKNAVLLAFFAAIFLIIPYVGAWIGGLIPFLIALTTGDSFNTALGVAIVMVIVQTLDNNLVEPYVVGGEVRLTAAATVLALIVGGTLWGIPGVMLFVPLAGISKIIFDHVEPLKPYGYLIGDQKPAPSKMLKKLLAKVKGWFK